MGRVTRDRTAEPLSRGQMLRLERGQRKNIFSPVYLTTGRIGNQQYSVGPYHFAEIADHRYVLRARFPTVRISCITVSR